MTRSSLDGPSGPASAGTAFHRVAADRGVSPQQIALARLLARSPAVIPVPGASRPASIADSAQAAELRLSTVELTRLEDALPC
ncbi:aldo/keto reductase [Streptomyces gelaticus]|uniref:aldo/keto reductase n=1 Tax=Streptomyces gelaticus TaxID=285446 RepID=UPI0027E4A0E5|nr:aldo/keto reductase [Streptomyces gelaticus]